MKVEKISDEIWLGSPPGSRTPRFPVTGDDVSELNRLVTHVRLAIKWYKGGHDEFQQRYLTPKIVAYK